MNDDDVRVLVVDDVSDAADALAETLALSGYRVWIATDGAAALALVESTSRTACCSTSACREWTATS
jgi:CheY-like chemotaxis protein